MPLRQCSPRNPAPKGARPLLVETATERHVGTGLGRSDWIRGLSVCEPGARARPRPRRSTPRSCTFYSQAAPGRGPSGPLRPRAGAPKPRRRYGWGAGRGLHRPRGYGRERV